ncbi:MAG: RNA-binding protein, partial [Chitinophagaceae bacterium]
HSAYYEQQPCRGYLSTMDNRAHFGTGVDSIIDKMVIRWPDGTIHISENFPVNQEIRFSYDAPQLELALDKESKPLFAPAAKDHGIQFKPVERDFIDYTIQATLPHKLSQYGPGIAVGDIDKNGFDDFYIGGTSGNPGVFFLQDNKGQFKLDTTRIKRLPNELHEEMGVLFFDADNDGDLDLYAVGGSYEVPPDHAVAQDRLFINNGKGFFKLATNALPAEVTNGSCVRATDFDKDGDLDLFIGGRVVSGAYPTTPKSFLLKNNGGRFTDVTNTLSPGLQNIGMVTDALWSDFDNDGKMDLVVTGEWMPVVFLKNTGQSFVATKANGVDQNKGWWNSLTAGDFDNDGDVDYIAGNLGLNSNYKATPQEPMTLLAKDLDNNASLDAMLFCYMKAEDGTRKPFPMHTKDDLASQLVSIRKRFPTYKSFGVATMNDLWNEQDRKEAIINTATWMESSYIENKGQGKFEMRPLPVDAQAAPVFGMLAEDINQDGKLDLMLVGNDYGMEPYSGRHDAFNGLCLEGDGNGNFLSKNIAETGFFVPGDAKGLAKIHAATKNDLWIATQNQDSLLVFGKTVAGTNHKWINLRADDSFAEVKYKNGSSRRLEFYYGSTFLSQSSRKLLIDKEAVAITLTSFKGVKRKVL